MLLSRLEKHHDARNSNKENNKNNIIARLPVKVMISTKGNPDLGPSSCRHADIDLRDLETARVVLITQCRLGGSLQKGVLNGRPMADREFERWRKRVKPDFSLHN